MDRGAWWAAVHGVAQSQVRLKQLSVHACIGEGNGNPLQYSCLENPRDRGAWWAAVYGVTQSQTWLKRLSSSCKHLFELLFLFPLDKYLEEKLLDHIVALFLILRNVHSIFHSGYISLHFYQQYTRVPFLRILQTLVISYLFDDSLSNRCEVISYCSFDLHLPNY